MIDRHHALYILEETSSGIWEVKLGIRAGAVRSEILEIFSKIGPLQIEF